MTLLRFEEFKVGDKSDTMFIKSAFQTQIKPFLRCEYNKKEGKAIRRSERESDLDKKAKNLRHFSPRPDSHYGRLPNVSFTSQSNMFD